MSAKKENDSLREEHHRLLAASDQYVALIQKQRVHLAGMDMKMKEMVRRILTQKRAMGGRSQTVRRAQHQIKHIHIMEGRLNQKTVKFDQLLYGNQTLRGEVDHLRSQRGRFSELYQRVSRALQRQHNTMDHLVEKSVLAYDLGSEALTHMLAVSERCEKDASLYHTEMTELQRVIDHTFKLRNFKVVKSRENFPLVDDEAKKRREQAKRERMGGESTETYQEVLLQGAETFAREEEENFAYYNYISELNNQSTQLIGRINELKGHMVHIELDRQQFDQQRHSQLKDLEGELELHRCSANDFQSQYTVVRKVLDQEKSDTADLFFKMSCDSAPITGQLGRSAQVTDDNVTQFIGILEERVYVLLMRLVQSCYEGTEQLPRNPLLSSYGLLPCDPPLLHCPPLLLHPGRLLH